MADGFAPTHHKVTSDTVGSVGDDGGLSRTIASGINTGTGVGSHTTGTVADNAYNTPDVYNNSDNVAPDDHTTQAVPSTTHTHPSTQSHGLASKTGVTAASGTNNSNTEGHSNFDGVVRHGGVEQSTEQARRSSLANLEERRHSSLASTPGPFNAPTTDDITKKRDAPPSSSVSSQNAPGKLGERGEGVMGALGFGGSTVERPKEEQGLGEKIVNFLGA